MKTTAVENHVRFFDLDQDGIVTPEETAKRFKQLGMPGSERVWTAVAKQVLKKLATQMNENARAQGLAIPEVKADAIPVALAHLGKHDSDTDSYDTSGALDRARFDAMFANTDRNGDGKLGLREIVRAAWKRKESVDGFAFSTGEYTLMWALSRGAKIPFDKRLAEATLDGTGFDEIVAARSK